MKLHTWVFRRIRRVKRRSLGHKLFIRMSKVDYEKHKESTRILVARKISEFNNFYNFKFNKIAIRNQRSRWGSCSKQGNLNFNYRLALIPDELVNYVIVHELCHLGEFNHSQKFWDLAAQTLPNHTELRKKLHAIRF